MRASRAGRRRVVQRCIGRLQTGSHCCEHFDLFEQFMLVIVANGDLLFEAFEVVLVVAGQFPVAEAAAAGHR